MLISKISCFHLSMIRAQIIDFSFFFYHNISSYWYCIHLNMSQVLWTNEHMQQVDDSVFHFLALTSFSVAFNINIFNWCSPFFGARLYLTLTYKYMFENVWYASPSSYKLWKKSVVGLISKHFNRERISCLTKTCPKIKYFLHKSQTCYVH